MAEQTNFDAAKVMKAAATAALGAMLAMLIKALAPETSNALAVGVAVAVAVVVGKQWGLFKKESLLIDILTALASGAAAAAAVWVVSNFMS